MNRTAARPLAALAVAVALLVGAAACSGDDEASPPGTTDTTLGARTASTNPRMGDLSDLDGATDGLSGDALACHDLSLTVSALALVPSAVASGAGEDEVARLEADVETLRSQVPAAVSSAFDTYATGVQAYADALSGVDLDDLTAATTRQQLSAAAGELETPAMVQALDEIEAFYASTCPAPAPVPTTAAP